MKEYLSNIIGFSILGLIVCPLYDYLYHTFISQTNFIYHIETHAIIPVSIILAVITFVALCTSTPASTPCVKEETN